MKKKKWVAYKIIDEMGDKIGKGVCDFDSFDKVWKKTKRKFG